MKKNQEQTTKYQHYVPQFYLKKFTNANNNLEILNCELLKIVSSRSPKNICGEDFFYSINNREDEISQLLETEFKKIESDISKVYDKIISKLLNLENITTEDRFVISTFMSVQYLRGPYMRKQIHKMGEYFLKEMIKRLYGSENAYKVLSNYEKETGKIMTKEEKEEVIKFAREGDYRLDMGNSSHLQIIGEMEKFRDLLFHKYWLVYISKSNRKFITSDNPVTEIFPDWAGKVFWGPDFFQRTHQFAATPDVAIIALNPKSIDAKNMKRKTLFDDKFSFSKIFEFNFNCANHATKYAYAHEKEPLQDIINGVNLYKENHPGAK